MRWLALSLLLGACASVPDDTSAGDRAVAELTAGRRAGDPQRCIQLSQLGGPQIIDARRISYRESGRREWISTLPGACPSLRRGAALIIDVYGGQMCENDRFRTFYPGQNLPGPYCRFGKFTPYDRPAR